jgi:hypothetical protein
MLINSLISHSRRRCAEAGTTAPWRGAQLARGSRLCKRQRMGHVSMSKTARTWQCTVRTTYSLAVVHTYRPRLASAVAAMVAGQRDVGILIERFFTFLRAGR